MTTTKKILLLGRAGVGKSSIRLTVFEGKNPQELLLNPLEPTRGISPKQYSWVDVDIGLFDTSGQELSALLQDEDEQNLAFTNSDMVIYIFDYKSWSTNQDSIINEMKSILQLINEKYKDTRISAFLHKIDKISEDTREDEIDQINNTILKTVNLKLYSTSLYPDLIYNTYNAMYHLISEFSEETSHFRNILDYYIPDKTKTLSFITNQKNSIIAQAMTNDFNTNLINFSHNLFGQLSLLFEEMTNNDKIEHIIITSTNKLNIILKRLNFKKFELKNVVCISQELSANKLIWLTGQLQRNFHEYINLGKDKLDSDGVN